MNDFRFLNKTESEQNHCNENLLVIKASHKVFVKCKGDISKFAHHQNDDNIIL